MADPCSRHEWEKYPLRLVETAYKHESPRVGWLPRVEVYNSADELVLSHDCLSPYEEEFVKLAVEALNENAQPVRAEVAQLLVGIGRCSVTEAGRDLDCTGGPLADAYGRGWNACMDEVEGIVRRHLAQPEAPAAPSEPLFLVLRAGAATSGSALWWGPNSSGYTFSVDRAGRYTREEYEEAVPQSRRRDNVLVPVEDAQRAARQVVRLIDALAAAEEQAAATALRTVLP